MHGLRLRSLIPSWLILVFGLAGACLNAQCVYADSATEVPLERLTVREKHFSLGGTNGYFTGWVTEQYPTGLLKSRSSVTNGLLEGLSEGWHTNGVKQVEEHYRAGVSHGLRVKWDENGQVVSEATVVGGKIEGVFRRWHSNGVLA